MNKILLFMLLIPLAAIGYESYFSPGKGTVGIVGNTIGGPVVVHGTLPFPVVVTSDLGKYVVRINVDGKTAWQVTYSTRGACYDGKRLWSGNAVNGNIDEFGVLTGTVIQTIAVAPKGINSVRCNRYNEYIVVLQRGLSKALVYDKQGHIAYTSTNDVYWSRGAQVTNGRLYVADSFRHFVYVEDISNGTLLNSFKAFYPADFAVDDDVVYLAEEHANRIVVILPEHGYARKVVASCPHPVFTDAYYDPEYIKNNQIDFSASFLKVNRLVFDYPISVCAKEHSGLNTLYSPNGVEFYKGCLYVGDTDNHRVLVYCSSLASSGNVFSDGFDELVQTYDARMLVAVITGLNNPNKVVPIGP